MKRMKRWGLPLLFAAALMIVPATASAYYHIDSANGGTWNGSQQTTITPVTDVGTWKCTFVGFSGSMAHETAETLIVHPTFSGCALGGQRVVVDTNTSYCNFTFGKTITGSGIEAAVNLNCESGGAITIEPKFAPGCLIKYPSQGPLTGVSFENGTGEGAGRVRAHLHLQGMSYSWTPGCVNSGGKSGQDTDGELSGDVLFTGSAAVSVG
jgi:hypothetical protein